MAQAAQRRFHLDAIYFIPSSRPPHKTQRELTPFIHRYAMVALACAEHPGFMPSLAEAPTGGALACLLHASTRCGGSGASIPSDHLYFIVGADQFLEIPTWKNYESLLDSCDFIIASRPGFRLDALRLVIPPEKLGRGAAHDSHKIVLHKSVSPSADHGGQPRLFDRNPRAPGAGEKHSRACAGARGGIHSRTGPVPVNLETLRPEIRWAVEAAQDKQAVDVTVLKLSGTVAFAEYFLLCSGRAASRRSRPSAKPSKSGCEQHGVRVAHREGKAGAEWVLLDYGGFIVHIFSDRARRILRSRTALAHRRAIRFPRARRSSTRACRIRRRHGAAMSAGGRSPGFAADPASQRVLEIAEKLAETATTLLITGESGTGKDQLARWIHEHGPRRDAPFLKIDCASLPPELVESELFGHERGAFTGAVARKPGRLEMARGRHRSCSTKWRRSRPATQAKLLRVLEERTFERLGGTETLRMDARADGADQCRSSQSRRRRAASARIFFSGSTCWRCPCRRCASAGAISAPLAAHFLAQARARCTGTPTPRSSAAALQLLESYAGRETCAS